MTSSLVLYEASQPGVSSVLARTLAAILNRCFQNLFKVNDLVIVTVNSSVALFADDTKCYRPITNTDDVRLLQEDLDRITLWCHDWRMDLNQSKCTVMSTTRNVNLVETPYLL